LKIEHNTKRTWESGRAGQKGENETNRKGAEKKRRGQYELAKKVAEREGRSPSTGDVSQSPEDYRGN